MNTRGGTDLPVGQPEASPIAGPGQLPRVVADIPLDATIEGLLRDRVEILPWTVAREGSSEPVAGMYTYGHVLVDGAMLDRLPGLKVISNYGVGVDHIDLEAAAARGIPVGNTPGVLEGATADLGFALLLAVARRVVEGDRYARSPEFLRYDPGFMLGREVHGTTLGILGLGRIGTLVARRATCVPIWPRPMIPRVEPWTSRPSIRLGSWRRYAGECP